MDDGSAAAPFSSWERKRRAMVAILGKINMVLGVLVRVGGCIVYLLRRSLFVVGVVLAEGSRRPSKRLAAEGGGGAIRRKITIYTISAFHRLYQVVSSFGYKNISRHKMPPRSLLLTNRSLGGALPQEMIPQYCYSCNLKRITPVLVE